ncbi:hypothetical protein E2I00_001290 [Balaenoptera physalus]|uniref:E2F/DP family winged-helix DNA-binding domain-containing protein n=1 Tax=Balaenoptera physalus TaxID=9770 RepID=A0A643CDR7_BALPH|nr:hypothetical protein E2I00_001290 [Balaenoptera physalus]
MAEAGPQAPPPPGTPSRHEKSLELLTTKFVSLLQEAKDGVLDLKLAADTLAVCRKWRIYDITNVLEEIEELQQREQELDQHKVWVQQTIRNITEDVQNSCLAYVTHEDICRCFAGDAIQAPSGTSLEVPIPEGLNGQKKYQIHLKSPALAQPQNASRPSSPQVTIPNPVPGSTEAQGVAGPAAEITVSGGPGTNSKDSSEFSSLPLGLTTLDTQPLQSSALLDSSSSNSSSSGPNPSTSFEPIKADPTGVLELPKELSEI